MTRPPETSQPLISGTFRSQSQGSDPEPGRRTYEDSQLLAGAQSPYRAAQQDTEVRSLDRGHRAAAVAALDSQGRKRAMKDTKKPAESTTAIGTTSEGFTDEERGAMKARAQELKAAARRGPRAAKPDGESEVLAKIAEMSEPDRALGERLHAVIKASAPALSPKLWYGMPAYAKDGKIVCFFQSAQKFKTKA
jgi:hypothetical protein